MFTDTGPTVVGPLISELRLKTRPATVLEAEGVLIDPIGAILAVLVVGRYVIPFALDWTAKRRNMEGFYAIAMFAAIGAAWLMEVTGLSMALGAFLVSLPVVFFAALRRAVFFLGDRLAFFLAVFFLVVLFVALLFFVAFFFPI